MYDVFMLKAIFALINTLVSSLIIFGILFGFGMGGAFESFKYHDLLENTQVVLILLLVPVLVFGILFGWILVFRPFKSLGAVTKSIVITVSIFLGLLCVLVAGQVGIFVRF